MKAVLILIFLVTTLNSSYGMSEYKINLKPFMTLAEPFARYSELQKKFDKGPLSISEHKERINILEGVLKKKPEWIDGYWMMASESFVLASSFPDPETPEVRRILQEGQDYADLCIQKVPSQRLCKFFRASLLAKIASIDGIFASLRHGKEIHDIWQEVTSSEYNFSFRPNVSLIGSAYYGLGLFYRLVPDNFLIDWFWDIRGNKDTSVSLHKKAIEYDKDNPCSMLMLSVALLCRHGSSEEKSEVQEAFKLLKRIQAIEPIDIPQAICKADSVNIAKNPNKTCGYTQAKYQEDEPIPTKK